MRILITFIFTLLLHSIYAQPFSLEWNKCYGGNDGDIPSKILNVNNKIITVGFTVSTEGNQIDTTYGNGDILIICTDLNGNLIWQKIIGGNGFDDVWNIKLIDGFLYLCGGTWSSTDDFSGLPLHNNSTDAFILKMDTIGNILDVKLFGSNSLDIFTNIQHIGNRFICSAISSTDVPTGDIDTVLGNHDSYIVVYDDDFNLISTHVVGGSTGSDRIKDFKRLSNGCYLFWGFSNSNMPETNTYGGSDGWVVKTDSAFNVLWQKNYGGSKADCFYDTIEMNDSTYLFLGFTNSNDSDIVDFHYCYPFSEYGGDMWVLKTNSAGNKLKSKTFGYNMNEEGHTIIKYHDDYLLIGGKYTYYSQNELHKTYIVKVDDSLDELYSFEWGISTPSIHALMCNGSIYSIGDGVDCDTLWGGTQHYAVLKFNLLTGIDEIPAIDRMSIYPNPAQDFITAELPTNIGQAQLSIYNLTGQLISKNQITQPSQQVSTAELSNGMYIFVIQTEDKITGRQRVVIAR